MHDNTAIENLIGCRLNERYALTRVLGAGGMGAVYLATDATLDREVAIKVILPTLVDTAADRTQLLARFWREARISAGLKHRNIVEVLDFGQDTTHQMPFLVMELLVGEDLESVIARDRRVASRRAVHILCQVCRAIAVAHGKKQIHRDLKPSNIFILDGSEEPDFAKVLDFGLARDTPDGATDQPSMTKSGTIMGTVLYMAPEQIEGGRGDPVDHRCDIYALGCVAYHALTGRPPFAEGTMSDILHAHMTKVAEPVHKLVPDVPRALSDAIAHALAKRPGHRPQTMAQLRDGLERALRPTPRNPVPRSALPPPPQDPPAPTGDDTIVELVAAVPAPGGEPASGARQPIPSLLSGTSYVVRDAVGPVRLRHPAMALLGDRAVLAYESDVSGMTRINARLLACDLSFVDEAIALTAAPRPALRPAVCGVDDDFAVAWCDPRASEYEAAVAMQMYTSLGAPLAAPLELAVRGLPSSLSLCRLASGRLAVAWTDLGPEPQVQAAILSRNDGTAAPVRRFGVGSAPVVASSKTALLAWHNAGSQTRIAAFGGGQQNRTCEIANAAHPALVALPDHSFAMAWRSTPPEPSIMVARVAPDGQLGASFRVGPTTSWPLPPSIGVARDRLLVCYVATREGRPHLLAHAMAPDLSAAGDALDLGPYAALSPPAVVGCRDHWLLAWALGHEIKVLSLHLAQHP